MKFNQEKLNKSKEQIEEIINSINLDKIPLFHSTNVPKNDNMVFYNINYPKELILLKISLETKVVLQDQNT